MPSAPRDKKLFPRGGSILSKSQKDKKMMKKVRKQVGKKPDLFGEKKVKKVFVKKNKKSKSEELPKVANDDNVSDFEDEDEIPKTAFYISSKTLSRGVKSFCFIRSIDEMGMAVSYPNGITGY